MGDNGKENGNYRDYRDYIGVIQGLCRGILYWGSIGVYWAHIGIMENNMETTILLLLLGLYRDYIGVCYIGVL